MKILCAVNQAECFRRGVDAPSSTVKIDVNPAELPADLREFVADHLYDGHKLGGRWHYDYSEEKGKVVTDEEFELWSPDLTGFLDSVRRAKEFHKDQANRTSHLSFEEWKMLSKEPTQEEIDSARHVVSSQNSDRRMKENLADQQRAIEQQFGAKK